MPSATDFPAHGKVLSASGNKVVFAPSNTRYELHLDGSYTGALKTPIDCFLRMSARKMLTVPSGGNFIAPIQGNPRTIQGIVRYADNRQIVIQAGCPIIVDLPGDDMNIDLDDGAVAVGKMVNIMVMPGAKFEVAAPVKI